MQVVSLKITTSLRYKIISGNMKYISHSGSGSVFDNDCMCQATLKKVGIKLIQLSPFQITTEIGLALTRYFKILVCNFTQLPITIRLKHEKNFSPSKYFHYYLK